MWLGHRHCSDVDGRVEVAAFRLVLAAERVAGSNLGRPGFRARGSAGLCADRRVRTPRRVWRPKIAGLESRNESR